MLQSADTESQQKFESELSRVQGDFGSLKTESRRNQKWMQQRLEEALEEIEVEECEIVSY